MPKTEQSPIDRDPDGGAHALPSVGRSFAELERAGTAALPLFRGLDEACLNRLLRKSSVQRCLPGEIIFEEGRPAKHLHVLTSGIVDLAKMEGRRECSILMLSAGDVFMPVAALFDEPYLTNARALTRAHLLLLPIDAVLAEARADPEFCLRLASIIGGHWRMAARHILDLKCRGAPERVAAFLLRLVDESPTPNYVDLPFSKRHLAARVGMTAETLSRALQTIADHGLFLRGSRILVRDRVKAEAFCGPPPYPASKDAHLDVHAL